MVVLAITGHDTNNVAEQSHKATPATASMMTHPDRDVLVSGIGYQHSQLHKRLLDQV
jgi:hypothetical protein